jgi:hypothetical protein
MDCLFQLHPPPSLLPDGAVIDVPSLMWNLEKTVEQNSGKWGWLDKACARCGQIGACCWAHDTGYLCEECRA